MKLRTIIAQLLLLGTLAVPTAHVAAQAQSSVRGTIESIELDEHYIVIDGKRLVVEELELVITYKGEPVSASSLRSGFTVMYNTRADGSLSEITLIGPADVLDKLGVH